MSRNQLDQESSAYLRAHKDNPVHWRSWNQSVFDEARAADKPILLSIGYAACHWCHVMNAESFTDAETAALINSLFIAVKVDREERPDIDQLYQAAANTLGYAGGWPLNIFLTPGGEPYFVAGYVPKEARAGQPAFKTVLEDIARVYREQRDAVATTTARVQESLAALWRRNLRGPIPQTAFDEWAIRIGQRFDIFFGGPTGAPKFPSTALVEFLWRAYQRSGLEQFNQLVQTSLTNMSQGGIYDHIGGGYARYATDERWLVPHFEKMLYDNAQIIDILTLVWQHNRAPLYRDRVAETVGWVLREMRVENGFASSIAADSAGGEGAYYLWSEAEIDAALKGTFVQRFKDVYNITREGGFQGKNILHRLGRVPGYPLSDADEALLAKQRALLLQARSKRQAPLRDTKVQADWNGLMIAALANAGKVFGRREWLDAALAAFAFVCKALGESDTLFHSWQDGKRGPSGFAEDYAHMARAALALHEATGDTHFLERAKAWTRTLDQHFWDKDNGGYFTASDAADPLIIRPRMVFEQAIPPANAVLVSVLGQLFMLTSDTAWRDRTNALIDAFSGEVVRAGQSMPSYLNGFETVLNSRQIVIVGPRASAKTQELASAVYGRSLPGRLLVIVEPGEALPEGHPAYGKTMEAGQPTAYICQNLSCSPPVTNPVALSQMLQLPLRMAPSATRN